MSQKRKQQQKAQKQQLSSNASGEMNHNNDQRNCNLGEPTEEDLVNIRKGVQSVQPVNNAPSNPITNHNENIKLALTLKGGDENLQIEQNKIISDLKQQSKELFQMSIQLQEQSKIPLNSQMQNKQYHSNNCNANQNNAAVPQLIVGNNQTIERKGILKNAQSVYQTEPLKAPIPVSTALYKNQKDIIQIDKLQHLQQSQLLQQQQQSQSQHHHNQCQNHHISKGQNQAASNQQINANGNPPDVKGEMNKSQYQPNQLLNFHLNANGTYSIYSKIQNTIIPNHLHSLQTSFYRKEGLKQNQEIQKCMSQYIQSKYKKHQQLKQVDDEIDILNQQSADKNQKLQKLQLNNLTKLNTINQEERAQTENCEEDLEEDEDEEYYEELEEDEEDDEEEYEDEDEEEEIEEDIEEEEEEDEDVDNDQLMSSCNKTKFMFSDKMDIDGLRKKRIAMSKEQTNNTIILNITAQKKGGDEGEQSIRQQKYSVTNNQVSSPQQQNVHYDSNTSSSASSSASNSLEGSLASQILKDKQNKKMMQIQQHQLQLQKQIDMYADAQEFKRLQLQQQQNLLKMQQQIQQTTYNLQNSEPPTYIDKINSDPSSNYNRHYKNQSQATPPSNDKHIQLNQQKVNAVDHNNNNHNHNNTKIQKDNNTQQQQYQRNHSKIQFSQDIKSIYDQLDLLDTTEKKRATMMKEQEFNIQMQNMIDCVGCKESLHQFLNEIIIQSQSNQKPISFDGININKNREICILDNFLESNFNIASFLQFHQNKQSMLENLNRNFSLFKKSIGQRNYRCHLHSKKPLPCLWKDNFEQLFDSESQAKDQIIEIDESLFLSNLDKYLKKRKFCGTCKENIMGEYQKLKENVEMNQDDVQYLHGEEDEHMMNDDCEQYQNTDQFYTNDQQQLTNHQQGQKINAHHHHHHHHVQHHHHMDDNEEFYNQNIVIPVDHMNDEDHHQEIHTNIEDDNIQEEIPVEDDDQEYEDEVDEEDEEEEEEEDEVDLDDDQIDLINCIKYCNKSKKISIPMEVDFIQEIMSKAQIDTSLVKHANTTEAAQDELLICLGQTLKDKLQTIWKNKKSEEIVRQLFLNILQGYIQIAMEKQGCKNSLEEYLEEDERAKEAKKLKNQKKKQKQKLKKQEKKQEEQKKQQEEEDKKKQEEELKLRLRQEARLLKKQQEEQLLKQKQLEEELKKVKQSEQSKKKKKGKKAGEVQIDQIKEAEEEEQLLLNQAETNKISSPVNQSSERLNGSTRKNSSITSTASDYHSNINKTSDSIAAATDESSYNSKKSDQQKKSNSFQNEFTTVSAFDNSKRNKTHQSQFQKEQQAIASPQQYATAAADANSLHNKSSNIKKIASPTSNFLGSEKKQTQSIAFPESNHLSKSISERERILLKSMGWREEQELIVEIPLTDINHYSQNKKKYDKERAFYRKTIREKFLLVINQSASIK